jgi:CRP/FNR family transcriptional regulator, cyclic AMP receptor protein
MSTKGAVISLLSRTSLFGGLEASDLKSLADAFDEKQFAKGDTLFERGDPPTHLFLVETGRVRLAISTSTDRKLSVRHATAGDLFGEIGVLDGAPRSADATAMTDVKIHCLERSAFRDLWVTRSGIATRVVEFLCRRLRDTTTQLESIGLASLEVRLAGFLLTALGDRRALVGKRVALELGFSQGELSHLLGASRPKVNEAMGVLEKAGALRRTQDRIFCDPEKLALMAGRRDEA